MKTDHPIFLLFVLAGVLCGAMRTEAAILTVIANHGSVTVTPNGTQYEEGEAVELVPRPEVGYCFTGWSGDVHSQRLVLNLTMDGDKTITANFSPWTPPIGIPLPSFGIFETYRMYDAPAARNPALTYYESPSGGYYTHYIDNTDPNATNTSNPYGTAAKPRANLPAADWPAGSVIEIHGGPYTYTSSFLMRGYGTAQYPIFVRGVGVDATTPRLNGALHPEGTYLIVEGLSAQGCLVMSEQVPEGARDTEYVGIRHLNIFPPDTTQGGSISVLGEYTAEGNGTNRASHVVIYNNLVHDFGDMASLEDDDWGGINVGIFTDSTWVVDNQIYHSTGCGGQVIGGPGAAPIRSDHTYYGRNIVHDMRSSGLSVKYGDNVVFSQNAIYRIRPKPSWTALGGGIRYQYHPTRFWILFNDISQCQQGFTGTRGGSETTEQTYVWLIGNLIHEHIYPNHLNWNTTWQMSGIQIGGKHDATIVNNTIVGYPCGMWLNDLDSYAVANNIIADANTISWPSLQVEAEVVPATTIENTLFYQTSGTVKVKMGSTIYTTMEALRAGTTTGDGCVIADPGFTNTGAGDFHLRASSAAIDAGQSSGVAAEVSDQFQQLYGIDLRTDIEGKPRTGAWEIGAYEYILSPVTNLAVSGTSQNSVTLAWTVPGEPGVTGQPATYDLRYAAAPITEGTWETATQVQGEPLAGEFGQSQSFTVTGLNPGATYYLAIQVLDEANHASPLSTAVSATTATSGNHAPILQLIGDKSVVEEETLTFAVSATDADGDPLTYSAGTLPVGAAFDAGTRTFTWTPTNLQSGWYRVMFQVSDGQVTISETITITVRSGPNQAPVLAAIGGRSTSENTLLSFSLSATDLDGDALTFSATGLPSGASFAGGVFTWTPTYDQAGSYPVTFTVSDGELTDSEQITITVANVTDQTAPAAQAVYPVADAIQVPLNPLIVLTISDGGSGVDASTVAIRVNGQFVYSGDSSLYESAYGTCRRTGTRASYRYYCYSAKAFDFDQQVTVQVNASDAARNAMTPVSYRFVTEMRSFGRNQPVSSGGDSSGHPAIVTDSQGNLWAAWHAGPGGAGDIYVAERSGLLQLWDTPVRLTNLASDQCNPVMAVGPDDKLHVAWQDNRRGNWDIYVSTSVDGSTWGDPVRVTDSDFQQRNPVIAVDQASPYHVYIAWERGDAGNRDIYLASSTTAFASKTITQITSNPADQTEPALAVGTDNTVYLIWTDQRNGSADIYGSSSAASAWANVPIVTGPGNQSNSALAVEPGTSTLHVLWVDDTAGNLEVVHGSSSGLPGSAISGTSLVDDASGADQSAPAIAAAKDYWNNTHVYACWQDSRSAGSVRDTDLYFVEIRSGTGGTNILVGDDGTNSNQSDPALGCDQYGQPVVLTTDTRGGTPRIYSACSVYMTPVAVASALITRTAGGRVGVDPASIDSEGDVSIQIPATACDCDVTVSISEIQNLPKFTSLGIAGYEIGPSGVQFALPATVTIPYTGSGASLKAPYWYDTQTGVLSQQGMTDITYRTLANGIPVISFKTTHLTTFYVLESSLPVSGSGGGGCALSRDPRGDVATFFVPYAGLMLLLLLVKRRDHRCKST
jgi:hypothetical protein